MYFTISDYTGVPSALVVECAADVNQQNNENVDSLMKPPSWGHLAVGVNFLLENDASFLHVDMDEFNALLVPISDNELLLLLLFLPRSQHITENKQRTPHQKRDNNQRSASSPNAAPPPQAAATPFFNEELSFGNLFLSAFAMPAQRIVKDSEWKKTECGLIGCPSGTLASSIMGNTCFMNATLQSLSPLMLACDSSKTEIVAFANFGQCTSSSSSTSAAAASSPVPFHHGKQAKDTHQQPAQPLSVKLHGTRILLCVESLNRVPFPSFSNDDGTGNFFLSAYAMSAEVIASDSEWKKTVAPRTNWPLQYGKYVLHELHSSAIVPYARFSTVPTKERAAIRQWPAHSPTGNFNALRPAVFLEFFAYHAEMADRKQHDAQELQLYLLDALHEDTNRVNKRQSFEQNYGDTDLGASGSDFTERAKLFFSSPVNELFNVNDNDLRGPMQHVQCEECSLRGRQPTQISVELPSNIYGLKLKNCMESHFSLKDEHYIKNDAQVTFNVAELDLAP
ncbi:hypothetical protein niasHT_025582 [Heterodera trifolii]|uniref:ubiquitinyl hydrolase 1 n=1 Tax=Heterodera trifolii TaxID=157864 RepID=A0ABD2K8A4_9BILA